MPTVEPGTLWAGKEGTGLFAGNIVEVVRVEGGAIETVRAWSGQPVEFCAGGKLLDAASFPLYFRRLTFRKEDKNANPDR